MKNSESNADFHHDMMRGFDAMVVATLLGTAGLALMVLGLMQLQERAIGLAQVTWYGQMKVNIDIAVIRSYIGLSFFSTVFFSAVYWLARKRRTFHKTASDIVAIAVCGSFCVLSAPTGLAAAFLDSFSAGQLIPGSFFKFMLEIGGLFEKEPEIENVWPLIAFKISVFLTMAAIYASVYIRPLTPNKAIRLA